MVKIRECKSSLFLWLNLKMDYMINKMYLDDLDRVYTNMSFKRTLLIDKMRKLKDLIYSDENDDKEDEINKVKYEVDIIREEINLIDNERKRIKNLIKTNRLISDEENIHTKECPIKQELKDMDRKISGLE